jgi:type III pantothenate kinase
VIRVYATDIRDSKSRLHQELAKVLIRIRKRFPGIQEAVLCSVVPDISAVCGRLIEKHLNIQPHIVGKDLKVPMKNNYHNPRQVGQDRLVCAYAAKCLYGYPAVVIDFGTATTFDVVSQRGSYEGGIIASGIRLSAESLFQKTALLPKIKMIRGPKRLIGKNTQESMLSGIFLGYGAMCCGLIDRIKKIIKGKPIVIVTGGYTRLMKKYIQNKVTKIDKDLVFKGMALLLQKHISS